VHSNTKIDRSSRLQVGVPGWLRTGHSSEHIIISARDNYSGLVILVTNNFTGLILSRVGRRDLGMCFGNKPSL